MTSQFASLSDVECLSAASLTESERTKLRLEPDDNVLILDDAKGSPTLAARPLDMAAHIDFDVEPARRWASERSARLDALIVFGSRAKGTAHEESDIDFYAVGRVSRDDARALDHAYPNVSVDVVRHTREEYQAKVEGLELCLEHNVIRAGVLIAGEERATYGKAGDGKPMVNRAGVASHFENACQRLRLALAEITEITERSRHSTLPASHTSLVAASADAAERTAKAMLVLAGLLPKKTHYIPTLRNHMVDQAHLRQTVRTLRNLPVNSVLAERIARMDGDTQEHKLHVIDYEEGGVFPNEPQGRVLIEHAHSRFYDALDSLVWLYDLLDADPAFKDVADRAGVELKALIGATKLHCRAPADRFLKAANETVKRLDEYEVMFDLEDRDKASFSRIAEIAISGG